MTKFGASVYAPATLSKLRFDEASSRRPLVDVELRAARVVQRLVLAGARDTADAHLLLDALGLAGKLADQ